MVKHGKFKSVLCHYEYLIIKSLMPAKPEYTIPECIRIFICDPLQILLIKTRILDTFTHSIQHFQINE